MKKFKEKLAVTMQQKISIWIISAIALLISLMIIPVVCYISISDKSSDIGLILATEIIALATLILVWVIWVQTNLLQKPSQADLLVRIEER